MAEYLTHTVSSHTRWRKQNMVDARAAKAAGNTERLAKCLHNARFCSLIVRVAKRQQAEGRTYCDYKEIGVAAEKKGLAPKRQPPPTPEEMNRFTIELTGPLVDIKEDAVRTVLREAMASYIEEINKAVATSGISAESKQIADRIYVATHLKTASVRKV